MDDIMDKLSQFIDFGRQTELDDHLGLSWIANNAGVLGEKSNKNLVLIEIPRMEACSDLAFVSGFKPIVRARQIKRAIESNRWSRMCLKTIFQARVLRPSWSFDNTIELKAAAVETFVVTGKTRTIKHEMNVFQSDARGNVVYIDHPEFAACVLETLEAQQAAIENSALFTQRIMGGRNAS